MYKQPKSSPQAKPATKASALKGKAKDLYFQDRNLVSTAPLKEQFEPTEEYPVRQHHRMAGVC